MVKKKVIDKKEKQAKGAKAQKNIPKPVLAKIQTGFYSDRYELVVICMAISITLNTIFIYFLWYLYTHRPQPAYFAMNQSKAIGLTGEYNPQVSDQAVLNMAMIAALDTTVFTFNATEIGKKLIKLRKYFTPEGYSVFEQQIQSMLHVINQGEIIQTSSISGLPKLMPRKNIGGIFAWEISVPLNIQRVALGGDTTTSNVTVSMRIQTVPVTQSTRGFQIYSYILSGD